VTSYQGRLELTWTNKQLRLLAHEDGSYEWVPPSDYRVAEVRLLDDVATVGAIGRTRAGDNLLIRGDALNALRSLASLPEFAQEYLGKVKLAYLDPPFNTQQSFLHYDDALEHSVWLTMMRDRLLQIRDLLAREGSLWVHLDDVEQAYARVMMDEVFGRPNFVATLIWQKNFSSKNTARHFSVDHDYILVYAKDAESWEPSRVPRTAAMDARYANPDDDPRGPWTSGDLAARNPYSVGRYPITTPSGRIIPGPPKGSYWRVSNAKLESLDADRRIWWGPDGTGVPRIKRFLSEVRQGRVPQTIWLHAEAGHTQEAKKEIKALFPGVEPFATPKPERLMRLIIDLGSRPGDVVLDCFVGSGTSAAVAHKMGRRWVAIEREASTVNDFAMPRLRKVVADGDPGGVTGVTGWAGGGGFRLLDVAPSMFESEAGLVFLQGAMTNGKLAEATAAQLGFEYDALPPFAGRKGRTRLAVIDGVVNQAVVRIIVGALGEGERVVVCGTGIDTDARPVLRELRPGSSLRKIPAALLDEYRSSRQLRLELAAVSERAVDGGSPAAFEATTPRG